MAGRRWSDATIARHSRRIRKLHKSAGRSASRNIRAFSHENYDWRPQRQTACHAAERAMQSLTITLPLPHKSLSPNARSHWRTKAKHTKEYRTGTYIRTVALCASNGPYWKASKAATVTIQWFTKTVMHPDRDNALSSLKAAFDGVTDGGFLSTDKELTHQPITFQKDAKNPRVVLTFTATK
jgi:crossover junction endodeoxyribonuclease RusA